MSSKTRTHFSSTPPTRIVRSVLQHPRMTDGHTIFNVVKSQDHSSSFVRTLVSTNFNICSRLHIPAINSTLSLLLLPLRCTTIDYTILSVDSLNICRPRAAEFQVTVTTIYWIVNIQSTVCVPLSPCSPCTQFHAQINRATIILLSQSTKDKSLKIAQMKMQRGTNCMDAT